VNRTSRRMEARVLAVRHELKHTVALLHALSDRDEANILAMMCCTSSEWGAPCLDALNTYYGRPNIPVGTLKDAGFLLDSSYNRLVAERYPHRIRSGRDAPDATALYRQVLARQPGKSVVVVAIGPLRNLARLLESEPDQHSPLGGRDLVAAKVALLSCMGGWNPAVPKGWGPEWNFAQDEKASRSVVENWPTPILFSGAEIGSGIMTGRRVALDCPLYNPLAMAIGLYVGYGRDRESWDQTAALVAVRGLRDYWKSTPSGYNRIGDKGANAFTTGEDRGHRYLVRSMPTPQLEDVIEDLMVSAKEGPTSLDCDIAFYRGIRSIAFVILAAVVAAAAPTASAAKIARDGSILIDFGDAEYSESGAWEDGGKGWEQRGMSYSLARPTKVEQASCLLAGGTPAPLRSRTAS